MLMPLQERITGTGEVAPQLVIQRHIATSREGALMLPRGDQSVIELHRVGWR
jgi:hypothetical protein